jgi:hypothetical protein
MNEELARKQESEEQAGAELPEGSSGGRRGETARQLIRRAKYASRRKFPAEEKIRIVMEGIRAEVSVSELCRREARPGDAGQLDRRRGLFLPSNLNDMRQMLPDH